MIPQNLLLFTNYNKIQHENFLRFYSFVVPLCRKKI